MPHEGTTQRVLARAAGHEHPDVVGLAGHRQQVVVVDDLHPLGPRQLLEVAAERVEAGRRARVEEVRRDVAAGEARSAIEARVLGPEDDEVLALADRRVVLAERRHRRRDLVEDERGVAVGLGVVHVVRALAAVHGDRARGVDATAERVALPRGGRRGSRPRRTCTSPAGRGWRRRPSRAVAPATWSITSRTARPTVALARLPGPKAPTPALKPAGRDDLAVHDHHRRDEVRGGVHAAQVDLGPGQRAQRGEHHGERLGRAAGEHRVHRRPPGG